ncbi:MAG: fumarylacetoacetate hydrolase family protein [Candidatus Faecivivens sp.]|nr:fumarylacetoacetate hydrolase family protein [Oscillospiraceae bacterium]MDY2712918.1 fumarylacetoacetate hydrolase family protein [Candidatus Faecivivens sp.]
MNRMFSRIETGSGARWVEEKDGKAYLLSAAPFLGGKETGESLTLDGIRRLAPFDGGKMICVGKNYFDHIEEMKASFGDGVPEKPVLFIKPSTCINNPEGGIPYPAVSNRVDYEGELAVVIGKKMTHVKAEDAMDYVFGLTAANDVTARDIQKSEGQWTRGKAFDLFAPLGPKIVTGLSPEGLTLITRLNGKERQRGNTSLLIHGVPELLAFITEAITLLPGDVVLTGTPAGVGAMQKGDTVEVEIQPIGVLRNHVV